MKDYKNNNSLESGAVCKEMLPKLITRDPEQARHIVQNCSQIRELITALLNGVGLIESSTLQKALDEIFCIHFFCIDMSMQVHEHVQNIFPRRYFYGVLVNQTCISV